MRFPLPNAVGSISVPHIRSSTGPRHDVALCLAASAAALVFYVTPWPPIYGIAFLVVAVLSWMRLDLTVLLVLAFAPFFMVPKHFGAKEFQPSEIFLVLDLVVASVYFALPRYRQRLRIARIRQSPFLPSLGLLLLGAALSTVFAADRHHALRAFSQVVVEPELYFCLLIVTITTRRGWWILVGTVVAIGTAMSAVALIQYVTHQNLSVAPGTTIEHVRAFYGSPDNLGLLLDRVIPLWLSLACLAVRQPRDRILALSPAPILFAALYLSGSRGAWAAVSAACLLVLLLVRPGSWRLLLACFLVGSVMLLLKGPSVSHALSSGHANTIQRRLDVWRSSVHMIRDHPLWGVGPDNFLHYYAPQKQTYIPCAHGLGYMEPAASAEPCLSHPHNVVLDFWLSSGVLGLAGYIWLQVVFWRIAWRLFQRSRAQTSGALVVGAMAAMAASLIHGLVDNSFFLMDLALFTCFFCALLSGIWTDEEHHAALPNIERQGEVLSGARSRA